MRNTAIESCLPACQKLGIRFLDLFLRFFEPNIYRERFVLSTLASTLGDADRKVVGIGMATIDAINGRGSYSSDEQRTLSFQAASSYSVRFKHHLV